MQDPIQLGDQSEPEPDLSLLPREDFYAEAHSRPEEALLVVEVSDGRPGYDRDHKIPLYARAGIREVWLVELERDVVEVFHSPASGHYQQRSSLGPEDELSPHAFPEIVLSVRELIRQVS